MDSDDGRSRIPRWNRIISEAEEVAKWRLRQYNRLYREIDTDQRAQDPDQRLMGWRGMGKGFADNFKLSRLDWDEALVGDIKGWWKRAIQDGDIKERNYKV